MTDIIGIFLVNCLQFIPVLLLLFFVACFSGSATPLFAGLLLFVFFLFDTFVLYLPSLLGFQIGSWNYLGKTLEFLWPLVAIYAFRLRAPREVGLVRPKKRDDLGLGIFLGTLFALCSVVSDVLRGTLPTNHTALETIFYQFTLPGLAEEIVYRGLFFALLDRYLKSPGLSMLSVSILFIMCHLLTYVHMDNAFVFQMNRIDLLYLAVITTILGVLRIRTESIWPSVLCHNFANGVHALGLHLIASI